MPTHFLYGRRESLHGKAEAYKKNVRLYLEAMGFSQTTDSRIQGTFEDMVYVNPHSDLGKKFLVEAKAEELTLKKKKFADELVRYFKACQSDSNLKFKLFIQGVTKPEEWTLFFSSNNSQIVVKWCEWYNENIVEDATNKLDNNEITNFAEFLAHSEVTIGSSVDLEQAALETQTISNLSIPRMAQNLLELVNRRKLPFFSKSTIVMNIIPIKVPSKFYSVNTIAHNLEEIYSKRLEEPPFIFQRGVNNEILTFVRLDEENPLVQFAKGEVRTQITKELQEQNPTLASSLIQTHLRRIFWKRGLYRDKFANILYYPMIDKNQERLEISDKKGKKRWVVKKIVRVKDTPYHKKGDINFFFHRGVEFRTPTYWGDTFVEIIPRRYYTLNGETVIDGRIRDKIDRKFRNPNWDRSGTRLGLMKFWKYLLFESEYVKSPEKWFEDFVFGNYESKEVNWVPEVIERNQKSIWEYSGENQE
jgi:hypothetical protein